MTDNIKLFNDQDRYTTAANELNRIIQNALEKIWVKWDVSIRDFENIASSAVWEHGCWVRLQRQQFEYKKQQKLELQQLRVLHDWFPYHWIQGKGKLDILKQIKRALPAISLSKLNQVYKDKAGIADV